MARGGWLTYLRPEAGQEISETFRLIVASVSGAALSLSYSGLYLSIYSWVCVGILLLSLFGVRPHVAFGCGFLHGLLFVLTALPWIATVLAVHGGISPAGGWGLLLLIAAVWGILTGAFAWSAHRLSRQSIDVACIGAPSWLALAWCLSHKPIISRAPCSSIFPRWIRTQRIGSKYTPRTSMKSYASAWPPLRRSPTFSYGLKRQRHSRINTRNSQKLPRRWRFASATRSLQGLSSGNRRSTRRTQRLAVVSCRTTVRCFLMRKAGAFSCTTKSISCRSANTSPFL